MDSEKRQLLFCRSLTEARIQFPQLLRRAPSTRPNAGSDNVTWPPNNLQNQCVPPRGMVRDGGLCFPPRRIQRSLIFNSACVSDPPHPTPLPTVGCDTCKPDGSWHVVQANIFGSGTGILILSCRRLLKYQVVVAPDISIRCFIACAPSMSQGIRSQILHLTSLQGHLDFHLFGLAAYMTPGAEQQTQLWV